ncbi:MAG: hypothetical protein HYV07_22920 [Deltaproteobacteria bacterium]|nr:hypothetical protein [Deltaproteobacteria bacterium]
MRRAQPIGVLLFGLACAEASVHARWPERELGLAFLVAVEPEGLIRISRPLVDEGPADWVTSRDADLWLVTVTESSLRALSARYDELRRTEARLTAGSSNCARLFSEAGDFVDAPLPLERVVRPFDWEGQQFLGPGSSRWSLDGELVLSIPLRTCDSSARLMTAFSRQPLLGYAPGIDGPISFARAGPHRLAAHGPNEVALFERDEASGQIRSSRLSVEQMGYARGAWSVDRAAVDSTGTILFASVVRATEPRVVDLVRIDLGRELSLVGTATRAAGGVGTLTVDPAGRAILSRRNRALVLTHDQVVSWYEPAARAIRFVETTVDTARPHIVANEDGLIFLGDLTGELELDRGLVGLAELATVDARAVQGVVEVWTAERNRLHVKRDAAEWLEQGILVPRALGGCERRAECGQLYSEDTARRLVLSSRPDGSTLVNLLLRSCGAAVELDPETECSRELRADSGFRVDELEFRDGILTGYGDGQAFEAWVE